MVPGGGQWTTMPFTMITGYIVRKSTVVFNLLNYRHSDVDVAYAIALD